MASCDAVTDLVFNVPVLFAVMVAAAAVLDYNLESKNWKKLKHVSKV